MTPLARALVPATLPGLFGLALVQLSVAGELDRYVRPAMVPFVALAGLALLGLSVWNLVRLVRPSRTGGPGLATEPEPHEVDHGHLPRSSFLLLVPTLLAAVAAPPALGGFTADRSRAGQPVDTTYYTPLPDGDPSEITVAEYTKRAASERGQATLHGRRVRLIGFVVDSRDEPGVQNLTRLRIACCAADALSFPVSLVGAPPLRREEWYAVVGQWVPTQRLLPPRIEVVSVHPIAVPDEPYLY